VGLCVESWKKRRAGRFMVDRVAQGAEIFSKLWDLREEVSESDNLTVDDIICSMDYPDSDNDAGVLDMPTVPLTKRQKAMYGVLGAHGL
jgi:hypothetical protein